MINTKTIIQTAEIPSIPHVLQQILSLADNPRTSSSDLEKYVTQEPALVAQLLKWVNSAAYSLPQRVSSISHAMIILGFSTVKSIASGMILVNAFDDISGLSKEFVSKIWKHTLSAAAIMKILCKKEDPKARDDLFLAAMIHDVGYMVLRQYFGDSYDALFKKEEYPSPSLEQSKFKINHAEIGAELLTEWKFPESVISLVRYHHDFEEFEGDTKFLHYLRVADFMAEEENLTAFFDEEEEHLDMQFVDDLHAIGWTWAQIKKQQEDLLESLKTTENMAKT